MTTVKVTTFVESSKIAESKRERVHHLDMLTVAPFQSGNETTGKTLAEARAR